MVTPVAFSTFDVTIKQGGNILWGNTADTQACMFPHFWLIKLLAKAITIRTCWLCL